MKSLSSVFGRMGLLVVTSMLTLSACSNDKGTVTASSGGATGAGGSSSAGGGSAVGGATGAGGSSSANGGSTVGGASSAGGSSTTGGDGTVGGDATNAGGSSSTGDGGAVGGGTTGGTTSTSTSCTPTKVPDNPLMTDFSEILDGTTTPKTASSGVSSISWGDKSATLTGGTFVYEQNTSDTPVGIVTGGALEIKATVATGEYSGFGFYFGPNCGSDASDYAGFKFDLSGSMTGVQLDIQMQMSPDYPLKDSNKGTCDYITAGFDAGTEWNYCTNPHVYFQDLTDTTDVSTTVQTVTVLWSVLEGGNPLGAIDPTQLLGIQLQFNCVSTDCAVDVTIDNLTFYK